MRYLHTMVRVTDLEKSLDFYCNQLGLALQRRVDVAPGRFTLVFLGAPGNPDAQVELTHNWDPETLTGGRNFGHLAYEVEDIYAACQRLQDAAFYRKIGPRIAAVTRKIGVWQIIAARFVYGTKNATMLFWGLHNLPLLRFVLVDAIGCVLGASFFVGLGYLVGDGAEVLLGTYKEEAIRSLHDLRNPNLKGLLRRTLGKIFNDVEIKGWCKEHEQLNQQVFAKPAEAVPA